MTSLNLNIGVKGIIKMEVRRPDGSLKQSLEFENLITNAGLDRLFTNSDFMQYVFVGSGSTPPTTSDTKMESAVANLARGTASATSDGSPTYGVNLINTYAFGQGAAAGNLTEIGLSYTNLSSYILNTRALIVDGLGNPTTITVLSDEYLTVTYTLKLIPNVSDVVQVFNIGGIDYTCTLRPANVSTTTNGSTTSSLITSWFAGGCSAFAPSQFGYISTAALADITSVPSQTSAINATGSSVGSYVSGTYYRDFTIVWNPGSGTMNVNSCRINLYGPIYQIGFSPALPKTTSNALTITLRVTASRV